MISFTNTVHTLAAEGHRGHRFYAVPCINQVTGKDKVWGQTDRRTDGLT